MMKKFLQFKFVLFLVCVFNIGIVNGASIFQNETTLNTNPENVSFDQYVKSVLEKSITNTSIAELDTILYEAIKQKDTANIIGILSKKISIECSHLGKFTAALKSIDTYNRFHDSSDYRQEYFMLQYKALIFGKLELPEKSNLVLLKLFQIAENSNDSCDMVSSLTNIAINNFVYENENVIPLFNRALNISRHLENCISEATIYFNMASYYFESGNIDSALYYNSVCLDKLSQQETFLEPQALLLLANCQAEQNNYSSAHKTLDNVIRKSINNSYISAYARRSKFEFYEKQNKHLQAEKNAEICLNLSMTDSIDEFIIASAALLKQSAKRKFDFERALKYQEIELNHTERQRKKSDILKQEASVVLLNERVYEAENKLLKKEIDTKASIISKEKYISNLKNVFISFLAVLIVCCLILLYLLRKKKIQEKLAISKMLESSESKNKILNENLIYHQQLITSQNKLLNEINSYKSDHELYEKLLNSITLENNWLSFIKNFELLHLITFDSEIVKIHDINQTDIRVICLIKLGLSNKEMAQYINISENGIKKAIQRVRKKLNASTESKSIDVINSFLNKLKSVSEVLT